VVDFLIAAGYIVIPIGIGIAVLIYIFGGDNPPSNPPGPQDPPSIAAHDDSEL